MAANAAECARTRAVVEVLEMLVEDLKERPLKGEDDPRLLVACEVAVHREDDLDADQIQTYKLMKFGAQLRGARAAMPALAFRCPNTSRRSPER